MKKKILMMLLATSLILSSCANNESKKGKEDLAELNIGVMYSADIIPLAVMQENDIDKKNSFELNMEVFSSAKDRDAALQAGELDGVFTDFIGVCMYQNAGIDVKITGSTDGDYQLVAGKNENVTSLDECKGKSIAISENTLIDYSLDYILEQKGYDSSYLEKVVVPKIPERVEMLSAGKIGMGLLPEPFATIAKNDGAVLLGSANELGLYPAVSAFLQSSIDKKSDVISNYYKAYDEAVDYVNKTDVSKLEDIIIEDAGFPESLRGSITLPEYRKNTLPKTEDLEKAIKWASKKQLCSESLKAEDLLVNIK